MVVTKKATSSDIESIVRIHISAFPDFFLTTLGEDFLKTYYSCFVKSTDGIVLCAENEGEVVGFSASAIHCKGFNSNLIKKNLGCFGWLSFKMLFTSPKSLIRLVKNLTKKSAEVDDKEDYAELYSIGVAKGQQGFGIGKQLLAETEKVLRELEVGKVSLTTDYYDNAATLHFYQSMKYEVLYEFVTYPDRRMYRLIKDL